MVHWWVLVPSGSIGDSFATKNWKKAKKEKKKCTNGIYAKNQILAHESFLHVYYYSLLLFFSFY